LPSHNFIVENTDGGDGIRAAFDDAPVVETGLVGKVVFGVDAFRADAEIRPENIYLCQFKLKVGAVGVWDFKSNGLLGGVQKLV
jgi:hypothetical protein